MSMRVSFDISDKDLSHFRDCMQRARQAVKEEKRFPIRVSLHFVAQLAAIRQGHDLIA